MGPNAKAGLGFGLAQGFQTMGSMLLDAQDRAERRAFQQHQIKMEAKDRAQREDQVQYQRWLQKEEFRRAGEASERAEQVRRAQAFTAAERDAAEYQSRGVDAFVEPPAINVTGDPMKPNGLQQSTSLPVVPRMVVGGYNPERDPQFQRTRAEGNYFTGKGYGVKGQEPPGANTGRNYVVTVGGWDVEYGPSGEVVRKARHYYPNDLGLSLADDPGGENLPGMSPAGGGKPSGRGYFGGGNADAEVTPPPGDNPALLRALNKAHQDRAITREQHADALTRYRTGKVTADQILGWLTGS